jgi:hypothetical protein
VLLVVGAWCGGVGTPPVALAAVVHGAGFEATVLGWTSWYGSYDLGPLGAGWCIDHGLLAPDATFAYVPTDVPDASDDVKASIAWALSTNDGTDPVTAAAVMLVVHDLMGATYPFGRMDVDALTTANLAGYNGREADVVATARRIKADASAHVGLRAPFVLMADAPAGDPDASSVAVTARLLDAGGTPVAGATIRFGRDDRVATTGADGRATVDVDPSVVAGLPVSASVPDPHLQAFAPTLANAQRIAQPHELLVPASVTVPTTMTTTATTAPTTSTSSTTAPAPPPSTTAATGPPPSSPTTSTTTDSAVTVTPTSPPSTSPPPTVGTSTTGTSTTGTSTSTTVPQAPRAPAAPPAVPVSGGSLPVTGRPVAGLVLIGIGLVLLGASSLGIRGPTGSRDPCGRRPGVG